MDEVLSLVAAGVNFHVQQGDASPRAVFLHGFGGDLHGWDAVWPVLGATLPALRYDLRGHGESRGGEEEPYRHADDLLAILDALGLQQVDLVGVSMGGSIAVDFALDHPHRVRALVLISPGLVAWEWSEQWLARWQPLVEQARAGRLDEARRMWWQHPLFATTRDSPAGPALHDMIMRFSGVQWVSDSQRPLLPDVERLHTLQAPTLLLTGQCDLADFRLIADVIEAGVSGPVQRVDMPGAGHLLQLEQPGPCARHSLAFLGG